MYKTQSSPGEVLGYVDSPAWFMMDGRTVIPCVPVEATGISYGRLIDTLAGNNDWLGSQEAIVSLLTAAEGVHA